MQLAKVLVAGVAVWAVGASVASSPAGASTFSVIYSFDPAAETAAYPSTGLTLGPHGTLFGIAQGVAPSDGAIFQLTPPVPPATTWTESVIYAFPGDGTVGNYSTRPLLRDRAGVLFGAAMFGGAHVSPSSEGDGTVFRVAPPPVSGATWLGRSLYDFDRTSKDSADGLYPAASLARGPGRAIDGTTLQGGACAMGTAFQLTPPSIAGRRWSEDLFSFPCDGSLGSTPIGDTVVYSSGHLFGTALRGGAANFGTVFELTPPSTPGGVWGSALIYAFPGGPGASSPSGLVADGAGGFFGVNTFDPGSVLHLTPPTTGGVSWTLGVLHRFSTHGTDGWQPNSDLYVTSRGDILGTTQYGGVPKTRATNGCGTIFKLSPPVVPAGRWREAILYRFTCGPDGGIPYGGLVHDGHGAFFGTTNFYGAFNGGMVFEIVP